MSTGFSHKMGSDECNLDAGFKDASSIITSSTISGNLLASSSVDVSNIMIASSSQDSDLRCEERLKIKIGKETLNYFIYRYSYFICYIGECKRLLGPGKNGTGSRDVYVTINLDREEIFRTSVIEKTLK